MYSSTQLIFLSTLSLRRATSRSTIRLLLDTISIHALLAESDSLLNNCYHNGLYFYPRSPCGERHHYQERAEYEGRISIHALLAESDPATASAAQTTGKFLSTLSLRRATNQASAAAFHAKNFYPRSPCGERLGFQLAHADAVTISIHALLAESDLYVSHCFHHPSNYFYPRSPCGERPPIMYKKCRAERFLSTLSLRRATMELHFSDECGGISIHALLAESDMQSR